MSENGGDKMAQAQIAYRNLRAEMARRNVSIGDISRTLGVGRDTVGRKLARKTSLALDEAYQIAKTWFPDCGMDYLFAEADTRSPDKVS